MAAQAHPYYASGSLYPSLARTAKKDSEQRRVSRLLLGTIALFLMSAPLTRIYIGSLPINLIDVLAAGIIGAIWVGFVRPISLQKSSPLVGLTLIYFLFVLGSWIRELTTYSLVIEPLYVLLRLTVGFSMVLIIPYVIRKREELDMVLKMTMIGVSLSATFAILYSLPQSGQLRLFLMQGSIFFPGRNAINVERLAADVADRASSPIGNPNISGSFFVLWFPLALMVWRTKIWGNRWSLFAMVLTVLTVGAALVTYGRSTILALGMVAFVVIVFRLFRSYITMSALVAAAALFILSIGMTSTSFNFELVIGKFEQLLEDPTQAHTDTARIASYQVILPFLEENPIWAVTGLGVMGTRGIRLGVISSDQLIWRTSEGEIHSHFAAPFFHYGFVAMIVLTLIALICGLRAMAMSLRRGGSPYLLYWQWLFAAWVGLVPYWLFTHIYVTTEQGNFFLFFLVGLTVALGQIDPTFRARRLLRKRWVYQDPVASDAIVSGGQLP